MQISNYEYHSLLRPSRRLHFLHLKRKVNCFRFRENTSSSRSDRACVRDALQTPTYLSPPAPPPPLWATGVHTKMRKQSCGFIPCSFSSNRYNQQPQTPPFPPSKPAHPLQGASPPPSPSPPPPHTHTRTITPVLSNTTYVHVYKQHPARTEYNQSGCGKKNLKKHANNLHTDGCCTHILAQRGHQIAHHGAKLVCKRLCEKANRECTGIKVAA